RGPAGDRRRGGRARPPRNRNRRRPGMSSVRIFEAADADRSLLAGRRVAVIGYGSQGHAHALNLHDSGIATTVGLRPDSRSAAAARAAGLDVRPIADAVAAARGGAL